jgi:hypothetical protein
MARRSPAIRRAGRRSLTDWSNTVGSAVFRALNRRPALAAELQPLLAAELLALREFEIGVAGLQAWCDVDDSCRTALELARLGIGVEVLPLVEVVAAALRQVADEVQPMRLAGQALDALRELLHVHDQQRRLATRAELAQASIAAIERMVAAGDRRRPLQIPAP